MKKKNKKNKKSINDYTLSGTIATIRMSVGKLSYEFPVIIKSGEFEMQSSDCIDTEIYDATGLELECMRMPPCFRMQGSIIGQIKVTKAK